MCSKKILIILSNSGQARMFKSLIKGNHHFEYDVSVINTASSKSTIKVISNILNDEEIIKKNLERWTYREAERILASEKPDILLVANDNTLTNVFFIKAANLHSIPSLLVQDGILGKNRKKDNPSYFNLYKIITFLTDNDLKFRYKLDFIISTIRHQSMLNNMYGHGNTTKIAVFGNSTREILISEGIDADKIVVTGNPKFDEIRHYKMRKEILRNKFNLSTEQKLVLLLTQYFYEDGIWSYEQKSNFLFAIVKSISLLENVKLLIKIHPSREKKEDYHRILNNLDYGATICQNIDINEAIAICDMAITVTSTTSLEAIAMGKPVIFVNLFDDFFPSFLKDSSAPYITDKDELLPTIKSILKNKNDRDNSFIIENLYKQDGKSSDRILKLIRRMTDDNYAVTRTI